MRLDVLDETEQHPIVVHDEAGARDAAAVACAVAALPATARFSLVGSAALRPAEASAVFRALAGQPRPFRARLALAVIEHKAAIEEAARAGCVAIELDREGPLVGGLATGIHADRAAFERAVGALRRVRGLGVATVAHLPLGLPDDDEGVFERTLRFCRRALIAVPLVSAAPSTLRTSGDDPPRMDADSVENGIHWLCRRLSRHRAIWRRSLWPGGASDVALAAGYRVRRSAAAARRGRYTARMRLLRKLNRTARAKARASYLLRFENDRPVLDGAAARRAWLRTKAASDARMRSLLIQVEGVLDLRGARKLLERVSQAVQAGYQRITIDVDGVEAVSRDVVTGFLAQNKARLAEVAKCTRIVNLRGLLESLRRQLEDSEDLQLIEFAARA
jgi:anti-anti-sigma regulatory factor